jgi:hypothetical protein
MVMDHCGRKKVIGMLVLSIVLFSCFFIHPDRRYEFLLWFSMTVGATNLYVISHELKETRNKAWYFIFALLNALSICFTIIVIWYSHLLVASNL